MSSSRLVRARFCPPQAPLGLLVIVNGGGAINWERTGHRVGPEVLKSSKKWQKMRFYSDFRYTAEEIFVDIFSGKEIIISTPLGLDMEDTTE